MPLTKKGKKIMSSMKEEYGEKKGEKVFYASANKGTITKVHGSGPFSKAEMDKGYKVCYTSAELQRMDTDRLHTVDEFTLANRRNGTAGKNRKNLRTSEA